MASITVRGLRQETKDRLRIRAARHGRSMEAEVRAVLEHTIAGEEAEGPLGTRIHELFAGTGDELYEAIPGRSELAQAAPVGPRDGRDEAQGS